MICQKQQQINNKWQKILINNNEEERIKCSSYYYASNFIVNQSKNLKRLRPAHNCVLNLGLSQPTKWVGRGAGGWAVAAPPPPQPVRFGALGHDNCQLVCVLPSILNRLLSIATCELPFYYFFSLSLVFFLLYYILFGMELLHGTEWRRKAAGTEAGIANNLGAWESDAHN